MLRRDELEPLLIHVDPIIRTAATKLYEIAQTDYRGPRPSEAVEAEAALESMLGDHRRAEERIRRHDERLKMAYAHAEATRRGEFTQAWQRGYEYVVQEGTELGKLREEYGLTRDEVEALADGMLPVPQQELLEDYPAIPGVDELETYARILSRPFPEASTWVATERKPEPPAEWSPGGFLNYLLDRIGERMLMEEQEGQAAGLAAARRVGELVGGVETEYDGFQVLEVALSERERHDARRYIDERRIRHPHNRMRTLDGRPVPQYWRDDEPPVTLADLEASA